jgi:hypothetical protein
MGWRDRLLPWLCKNSPRSTTRRMAFSDRLKPDRAEKLSLPNLRSEERFVLSIFRAAAFSHNQDPFETLACRRAQAVSIPTILG